VVPREELLVARKALLDGEKELTRTLNRISADKDACCHSGARAAASAR
jgi:hypothetical protein